MAAITYSIKKNRINRGICRGFSLEGEDRLTVIPEENEHFLFLAALDGAKEDMTWGRLHRRPSLRQMLSLTDSFPKLQDG